MKKVAINIEKLKQIQTLLQQKDMHALVQELPILLAMVDSLLNLFEALSSGLNIFGIRQMFGVKVRKDKRSDDQVDPDAVGKEGSDDTRNDEVCDPGSTSGRSSGSNASKSDKNKNHPGKCGVEDYPTAEQCHHHHSELKPGDKCPECGKGKLKPARVRQQILFEGSPPIQPVCHFLHDLKCNICDLVFKVEASLPAKKEGLGSEDRYGYSAISMIVICKYFADLPWYRSSRLHNMFGVKLPPSTQFDQCEKLANVFKPVNDLEKDIAAQSKLFMMDDTGQLILDKRSALKERRTTGEVVHRYGGHSSVVVAFNNTGHPIVQIKTDIIHAGEWIDNILQKRDPRLACPMVASDRLKSNKVTETEIIDVACNQHARQNFVNHKENAPNLVKPILSWYKEIFKNDAMTLEMNPAERLKYHKNNSAPIMDSIVCESRRLLDDKVVTPNSDLGGDCSYILKHEPELRAFHEHEGAPLSNNLVERIILYLVLLRKNTHFFKTLAGAAVADVIFNVGLSAFLSGTNLFQYFTLALQNADDVRENPQKWLPWNFNHKFPNQVITYPDRKRKWPSDTHPYISPHLLS